MVATSPSALSKRYGRTANGKRTRRYTIYRYATYTIYHYPFMLTRPGAT